MILGARQLLRAVLPQGTGRFHFSPQVRLLNQDLIKRSLHSIGIEHKTESSIPCFISAKLEGLHRYFCATFAYRTMRTTIPTLRALNEPPKAKLTEENRYAVNGQHTNWPGVDRSLKLDFWVGLVHKLGPHKFCRSLQNGCVRTCVVEWKLLKRNVNLQEIIRINILSDDSS